MPSFIRNPKEFWSGAMFLFFGLAAVIIGQDYELGSAGRMGPGYFPSVLGGLLALIGFISVVRACFTQGDAIGRFAFKQAFLVLFAVTLFGLFVRVAGLLIAIPLMVIISSRASMKFRWQSALLLSLGAALFCWGVFVWGLGVPLPILGTWFEA